jgi:hypothetical protein
LNRKLGRFWKINYFIGIKFDYSKANCTPKTVNLIYFGDSSFILFLVTGGDTSIGIELIASCYLGRISFSCSCENEKGIL